MTPDLEARCPCCRALRPVSEERPFAHLCCQHCGHKWRLVGDVSTYYAPLMGRSAGIERDTIRKNTERAKAVEAVMQDGIRVLEIGCAEGTLGALLKDKYDLSYVGVEISKDANAAATRLDEVWTKPLQEMPISHFDVALAFHVFEHIADIDSQLLWLSEALAECGKLVIEVPCEAGNTWLDWDYNVEHLHYFSAGSLTVLLNRHGFLVPRLETGHYDSAVYNNSLRAFATVRESSERVRARLIERFKSLLGPQFKIYAVGGDFRNYVLPFLSELNVMAIYDSDPTRQGTRIENHTVRPFEPQDSVRLPILIASYRYRDQIQAALLQAGVAPELLFGLDDLFR